MTEVIDANYWRQKLNLEKHPEGGYFREGYRSQAEAPFEGFEGERPVSTAIYYLLEGTQVSKFHRIKSDEMWHFYDGSTLIVYEFDEDGQLVENRLGKKIELGDRPQLVVKANRWFGAALEEPKSFALCGCTVAPGFHFDDFEMAERETLLRLFPDNKDIIQKLT